MRIERKKQILPRARNDISSRKSLGGTAKRADDSGKVFCVLKEANGGGACGSGRVTGSDVFESDSADGDDGNLHGLTNFAKTVDALGRAVKGLRRRVKNWTEVDIVRAIAGGTESGAERMARNADEKIERLAGILCETVAKTAGIGNGKTILSEMNAARASGKGDVDAIVNDNARLRRADANCLKR